MNHTYITHTIVRAVARLATLALLIGLVLNLPVSAAQAASFTITTLADSGPGSLRAAIEQANATAGADSITFRVAGTIRLVSSLPSITDSAGLTINGAQAITLDGNNAVRPLRVESGAALTLFGLTFINGYVNVDVGGAIYNLGTTTVRNSTFIRNASGGGGAIYNQGKMTVIGSSFTRNSGNVGGGIASEGTLTVIDSSFTRNGADAGGGLYNGGFERMTVSSSTFDRNHAYTYGGGIASPLGALSVTNSTLSRNQADVQGGAIQVGRSGLTLTNSTLEGNSAALGGSIKATSTTTLHNSIVASSPTGGNCSTTLVDGGGNISFGDTTCPGLSADPKLGPLHNNGGPTETMALRPGSAAINAGVGAYCPNTDQRGMPRPQGAHCDSGAFEHGGAH